MVTVGTGKHTYQLVEDWVKLPAGWTLGQTGIVSYLSFPLCLSLVD